MVQGWRLHTSLNSNTGFTGVTKKPGGEGANLYQAKAKGVHLGSFTTAEEAALMYAKAVWEAPQEPSVDSSDDSAAEELQQEPPRRPKTTASATASASDGSAAAPHKPPPRLKKPPSSAKQLSGTPSGSAQPQLPRPPAKGQPDHLPSIPEDGLPIQLGTTVDGKPCYVFATITLRQGGKKFAIPWDTGLQPEPAVLAHIRKATIDDGEVYVLSPLTMHLVRISMAADETSKMSRDALKATWGSGASPWMVARILEGDAAAAAARANAATATSSTTTTFAATTDSSEPTRLACAPAI